MPMASSKRLEKLRKYTKDDIVDAIGGMYIANELIDSIIARIDHNILMRLMVESEQADKAETEALKAVLSWRKNMECKYGGVPRAKSNMTYEERQHGITLEVEYIKAQEKAQALDRRVNEIMGIKEL